MLDFSRKQEKTEAFKPGRNAQLISGKGKSFSQARCEVFMLVFLTFQMALAMSSPNCHSKIFTILSVSKPQWSLRMFADSPRNSDSKSGLLFDALDTPSPFDKGGGGWPNMSISSKPRWWNYNVSELAQSLDPNKWSWFHPRYATKFRGVFPHSKEQKRREFPPPKPLKKYLRSNSYLYSNSHLFTGLSIHICLKIYVACNSDFFVPFIYSQLSIHSRRSATSDIVKCVFKRFRKIQMLSSNWAIKKAMCFFCLHIPGIKMSHPN